MAFDPSGLTAGLFIRLGGAFLLILLGGLMVLVRPRRLGNLAPGSAILLLGLAIVAFNVERFLFEGEDHPTYSNRVIGPTLYLASAVAMVWAAWASPSARDSWKQGAKGPLSALLGVAVLVPILLALDPGQALGNLALPFVVLTESSIRWVGIAAAAFSVVAGERLRAGDERTWAILAPLVALQATIVGNFGNNLMRATEVGVSDASALAMVLYGATVAFGVIWLLRAATGPSGRASLTVCLGLLGAMTVSLLGQPQVSGLSQAVSDMFPGMCRLAAGGILAYAIFAKGILEVPLSSLQRKLAVPAAIFVLVLFAAAQLLQDLIGGGTGLAVGGGVALVSIVAGPRLDSLLHHGKRRATAEESYRDALRLALRDRRLSATEQRSLMVLADQLGIRAARAAEIQDEVALRRKGRKRDVESEAKG